MFSTSGAKCVSILLAGFIIGGCERSPEPLSGSVSDAGEGDVGTGGNGGGAWTRLPVFPEFVHATGAVIDQTVLVAGYTGTTIETWTWGDDGWQRVHQGVAGGVGVGADDGDLTLVAVNGGAFTLEGDDLMVWAGDRWREQVVDGIRPSPRKRYGMTAYNGEIIVTGGAPWRGGGEPVVDTWSFDGAEWRRLTTDGPELFYAALTVWQERLLLIGVEITRPERLSAWRWAGTGWMPEGAAFPLTDGHPSGPVRAATLGSDVIVSVGGQMLRWANDGWSLLPVPGPVESLRPYALVNRLGDVTVVGGRGFSGAGGWGATGAVNLGRVWRLAEGEWAVLQESSPLPRRDHAMVPTPHGVLLFGGLCAVSLDDAWVFEDRTWSRLRGPHPSARHGHAMATLGEQVVLFGGRTIQGGSSEAITLGDTWIWTGSEWISPAVSVSPPPLAFHSMATFDDRVVLFGGLASDDAPSSQTWIWDGAGWSNATAAGSPPPRAFAVMASASDGIVVAGGSGIDGPLLEDMWRWDGQAWSAVSAPNEAFIANLAGLAARDGQVLALVLNGSGGANLFQRTVDGWRTLVDVPWPVRVARRGGLAWQAEELMLFGGTRGGGGGAPPATLGSTWLVRLPSGAL